MRLIHFITYGLVFWCLILAGVCLWQHTDFFGWLGAAVAWGNVAYMEYNYEWGKR